MTDHIQNGSKFDSDVITLPESLDRGERMQGSGKSWNRVAELVLKKLEENQKSIEIIDKNVSDIKMEFNLIINELRLEISELRGSVPNSINLVTKTDLELESQKIRQLIPDRMVRMSDFELVRKLVFGTAGIMLTYIIYHWLNSVGK